MAAPHTRGTAARPMEWLGRRKRGEIQTPIAQDAAPTSTAITAQLVALIVVNSRIVRIATPAIPISKPRPLSQLILCWRMPAPIRRIHRGSLATSSAANPEETCCSAQCRVPCPIRKKSAPRTAPAIQCSRGRPEPLVRASRDAARCYDRRDRLDGIANRQVGCPPNKVDREEGCRHP